MDLQHFADADRDCARGPVGPARHVGPVRPATPVGPVRPATPVCPVVPAVHVGPVEHIWGSLGSLRKVPGRTQRHAVQALAELRAAVAFVRRQRPLLRVIAVETQNGSKLS